MLETRKSAARLPNRSCMSMNLHELTLQVTTICWELIFGCGFVRLLGRCTRAVIAGFQPLGLLSLGLAAFGLRMRRGGIIFICAVTLLTATLACFGLKVREEVASNFCGRTGLR